MMLEFVGHVVCGLVAWVFWVNSVVYVIFFELVWINLIDLVGLVLLVCCWFDLVVAWLKVLVTGGSWWWLVGFCLL